MLKPGKHLTTKNIEATIDAITTVRHLKKSGLDLFASMIERAVMSLLSEENPDIEFIKIYDKAQGHVIAWGRINDVWKEPVWDWKTGKLLYANSPGNWSLHDNFNIPPESEPMKE